jgi:hypothetical protein
LHGGGPGFESPRLHPSCPGIVPLGAFPQCQQHLDNAPRATRRVARPWTERPSGRNGGVRAWPSARTARNDSTKMTAILPRTFRPIARCALPGGPQGLPWASASCGAEGRAETVVPHAAERICSDGRWRGTRRLVSGWRAPVQYPSGCWGTRQNSVGLRKKSTRGMPRWWRPRKDAVTRRNAPGRRWRPEIRGCPNGATRAGHARAS